MSGQQFTDTTTPLDEATLNALVVAQSYRISGPVPSTSGSLTLTMPAQKVVVNPSAAPAVYLSVAATSQSVAASKDTYFDLGSGGTYTQVAVTNGAGEPPLTANSLRLWKVVSGASAITDVRDWANTSVLGPPIVVQAHHSAAFGAPSGAWQTSPLNTTLYDTLGSTTPQHSTTVNNSRLTCQVAGYYHLTGTVQFSALATGTMRGIRLVINATPSLVVQNSPPLALSCLVVTTTTFLNVSDYLEMQFFNDSTDPAAIYSPNLMMELVR